MNKDSSESFSHGVWNCRCYQSAHINIDTWASTLGQWAPHFDIVIISGMKSVLLSVASLKNVFARRTDSEMRSNHIKWNPFIRLPFSFITISLFTSELIWQERDLIPNLLTGKPHTMSTVKQHDPLWHARFRFQDISNTVQRLREHVDDRWTKYKLIDVLFLQHIIPWDDGWVDGGPAGHLLLLHF